MKWLEFIKVQTANRDVAEILLKLVGECKKCHGLLEAKVLNHSSLHDWPPQVLVMLGDWE